MFLIGSYITLLRNDELSFSQHSTDKALKGSRCPQGNMFPQVNEKPEAGMASATLIMKKVLRNMFQEPIS